jgi:hypothetical protein
MKTFLTFILITGFCFAEEPVKPLPKDVQTIVDSREADLQAARIAFDKAVFEANKKAITKMEAQVKSSTQKGDLDGALASRKFVEDWNKEKEAVAVSGALGGAGPGEKKNDLAKLIVGKWEVYVDDRMLGNVTFTESSISNSWGENFTYTIDKKSNVIISAKNNPLINIVIRKNTDTEFIGSRLTQPHTWKFIKVLER